MGDEHATPSFARMNRDPRSDPPSAAGSVTGAAPPRQHAPSPADRSGAALLISRGSAISGISSPSPSPSPSPSSTSAASSRGPRLAPLGRNGWDVPPALAAERDPLESSATLRERERRVDARERAVSDGEERLERACAKEERALRDREQRLVDREKRASEALKLAADKSAASDRVAAAAERARDAAARERARVDEGAFSFHARRSPRDRVRVVHADP
jgi:hypothetical protein